MNNSTTCVARAGQGPWIKRFLAPADRGSVNEYENCHYFYCLPDRPPGTAPGGEPAARMGQLHPVCRAHVGWLSLGMAGVPGAMPPAWGQGGIGLLHPGVRWCSSGLRTGDACPSEGSSATFVSPRFHRNLRTF